MNEAVMKTSIVIFPFLVLACTLQSHHLYAQSEPKTAPNATRLSTGISVGHYRYDPGIAIEFTTRAIFQNHLSLRIRGSVQWLEAYQAIHYQRMPYQTFSTGLVYNGKLFERTRFYAEFGMLGIIPDARFSDKTLVEGFYEFNGVE